MYIAGYNSVTCYCSRYRTQRALHTHATHSHRLRHTAQRGDWSEVSDDWCRSSHWYWYWCVVTVL